MSEAIARLASASGVTAGSAGRCGTIPRDVVFMAPDGSVVGVLGVHEPVREQAGRTRRAGAPP
ncbi:hypothetical protein AMK26_20480 [Streptomyces sp. CB03234]|nr:hypothetical protein AMK26_20480 [Streptomyces sp. CB03234]